MPIVFRTENLKGALRRWEDRGTSILRGIGQCTFQAQSNKFPLFTAPYEYSDWLRDWLSSLGKAKNFHLTISSRLSLGTSYPMGTRGSFPGGKAAGA
jgi:hypothetical protein